MIFGHFFLLKDRVTVNKAKPREESMKSEAAHAFVHTHTHSLTHDTSEISINYLVCMCMFKGERKDYLSPLLIWTFHAHLKKLIKNYTKTSRRRRSVHHHKWISATPLQILLDKIKREPHTSLWALSLNPSMLSCMILTGQEINYQLPPHLVPHYYGIVGRLNEWTTSSVLKGIRKEAVDC